MTKRFYMYLIAVELIAIGLLIGAAVGAYAQTANCAPRDKLVAGLGSNFGEVAVSRGLASNRMSMTEMFANRKTGTWTIVVTGTLGIACVKASGIEWFLLPQVQKKGGVES